METILAIVGLALGIASLVPAFTSKDQKKKIVYVAVGLSVVGIFAYQVYDVIERRAEVRSMKREMLKILAKDGPMPFEQLLDSMYFPDYSQVDRAIDMLVAEDQVTSEVVDVQSSNGTRYRVRVYGAVAKTN